MSNTLRMLKRYTVWVHRILALMYHVQTQRTERDFHTRTRILNANFRICVLAIT